jgi:hypothetical protein
MAQAQENLMKLLLLAALIALAACTPPPSHGVHVQFRPNRVEAEFKDYTGDQTRMLEREWTHRQWCDLMTGIEQPTLFGGAA